MALVTGYSSSSDSDDNGNNKDQKPNVNNGEHVTSGSKKRYHFSKRELKQRKLQRSKNGPWGIWSGDEDIDNDLSGAHDQGTQLDELSDSDGSDLENEQNRESTNFYGSTEADYQGRGFLYPPLDVDVNFTKEPFSFKAYLPKRNKYTFEGHKSGTTSLKFLPKTGHLFLSGGNDNTIRIWDFYHDRKCIRDFEGHSKAIKSLNFVADGKNFVSTSFDHTAKIWDTEKGIVSKRLKFRGFPTCSEFRPSDPNEFIVGLSDSRILHYDTRISEKNGLVQTYDHHLSSILDVKYFPDGSKFISSSEDKTVRIWDSKINIPIKQISDTTQHSMPFINIHPDYKHFCTQSMDNSIYTYDMKPKYRKHPNKIFKGQKSVGYAIGFTFAPDGHYICSGDVRSKVLLWDWTTSKLLKEISLPGKLPITTIEWHPQETSKILCSGPVGNIYMID